jgi:hypothetical protein
MISYFNFNHPSVDERRVAAGNLGALWSWLRPVSVTQARHVIGQIGEHLVAKGALVADDGVRTKVTKDVFTVAESISDPEIQCRCWLNRKCLLLNWPG